MATSLIDDLISNPTISSMYQACLHNDKNQIESLINLVPKHIITKSNECRCIKYNPYRGMLKLEFSLPSLSMTRHYWNVAIIFATCVGHSSDINYSDTNYSDINSFKIMLDSIMEKIGNSYDSYNIIDNAMQAACYIANREIVKLLLPLLAKTDGFIFYNKFLSSACYSGDVELFKFLLDEWKIYIDKALTRDGSIIDHYLIIACNNGDRAMIDFLIDLRKTLLDPTIKFKWNKYFNAVCEGMNNCHKYNSQLFIPPERKENLNYNLSCCDRHFQLVKYMIKNGADDFNHSLSEACREGNIELVKFIINLVKSKSKININKDVKNYKCKASSFISSSSLSISLSPSLIPSSSSSIPSLDSSQSTLNKNEIMPKKSKINWKEMLDNACYGGQVEILRLLLKDNINNGDNRYDDDGDNNNNDNSDNRYDDDGDNNDDIPFTKADFDDAMNSAFAGIRGSYICPLEIMCLLIKRGATNLSIFFYIDNPDNSYIEELDSELGIEPLTDDDLFHFYAMGIDLKAQGIIESDIERMKEKYNAIDFELSNLSPQLFVVYDLRNLILKYL